MRLERNNLFTDDELARVSRGLKLSPRQEQILTCLLQSMTDRQIATRLNIAFSTVRMHLNRLFMKVGATDRSELLIAVFRVFRMDCRAATSGGDEGTYVADVMPLPQAVELEPRQIGGDDLAEGAAGPFGSETI